MSKGCRIAITGIGPLTAGGSGNENVLNAILKRRTGLVLKKYLIDGDPIGEFYLHEIKDFDISGYKISSQALEEIRSWKEGDEIIDLYYFLAVISLALGDSGLNIDDKTRNGIGLVLAHENIGLDHFYWKVINELSFTGKDGADKPSSKKGFLGSFYKKFHRTGYELQTFMSLHHIAKAFDIHGYSLFLNNACASGLYALEAAADAIRSGKCSSMVVAAVDCSSVFKQMWFNEIGVLAKDGRIKPFAADRDGFTIGDGGAALVLESLESAKSRKAAIYAEYLGSGFVLEGWKVIYPDVSNDYYADAMQRAIKGSGLNTSDIDLLVPHGVGANIIDNYEARAVRKVFGKDFEKPVITALKPYIGHTLGSTALLETAIMLLAIKGDVIPATLNCDKADPKLGINVLKDDISAKSVKTAMKTACGFAGFNAASVFKINN